MKTSLFRSAVLAAVSLFAAASYVSAAPVLNLYYDPATGNLKLQNTTSGSLSLQSFSVLTLGNGSIGTATGNNQGYLSTGSASLPTFAFPVSNMDPAGLNGLYSQAGGANVSSVAITLSPYAGWSTANPLGPVGSYWDLGNIAVTGMTQADLNARFLTDPDSTPPSYSSSAFGQFTFSYQISPGNFSDSVGDVVAVVPEPSSFALLAIAAGASGVAYRMRRRKQQA